MRNPEWDNPEYHRQRGNFELGRIFGHDNRHPFDTIQILDTDRNKASQKYLVSYNPTGESFIFGLGRRLMEERPLPRMGDTEKWLEKPRPDQQLVIKTIPYDSYRGEDELLALLKTNQIFSRDAVERPMRLLGHGVGHFYKNHYLFLEYISENFTSLDKYYMNKNLHNPEEIIDIAVHHARLISLLHQNGIAHGDIEAPGMEHIFWNPDTHMMRIIDFDQSKLKRRRLSFGTIAGEQAGIFHAFFTGLTGKRGDLLPSWSDVLMNKFPMDTANRLEGLANITISRSGQPFHTPEGSQYIYEQLQQIRDELLK